MKSEIDEKGAGIENIEIGRDEDKTSEKSQQEEEWGGGGWR